MMSRKGRQHHLYHSLSKKRESYTHFFDKIKKTEPLIKHNIVLLNPLPIKQRYRPRNPRIQKVINNEVDKMLGDEIIEPSGSSWSSPSVLPRKTDVQYRFCTDFRKTNEASNSDAYPLPFINAILDTTSSLHFKHWFKTWILAATVNWRQWTLHRAYCIIEGLISIPGNAIWSTFCSSHVQRLMDKIISPELDPYYFNKFSKLHSWWSRVSTVTINDTCG